MTFSIQFTDETLENQPRIKVIGVGGSGGNAINTMINFGLEGVEFIVVNTDVQALAANAAPLKLSIGNAITRGLGAGADPEKGRKAALEDATRLKELVSGADMVFITAGMGGGTGTGAAPVIAQIAREEGALTVGVATRPFSFEGKQRARRAEAGLAMLTEHVDTLITIPNEKLLGIADEDLSFIDAFRKADEVLYQAVKGISDLVTHIGHINVDFADVRAVMQNMGRALMGTGCAKGQGRARLAAEQAISSPLLDDISVAGATGILINFVGSSDMKMREINDAASMVREQASEDANIIFGTTIDETLGDMVKVTVIATGFDMERFPTAEVASAAATASSQQKNRAQAVPVTPTIQQPPARYTPPAVHVAHGISHGAALGAAPSTVRPPASALQPEPAQVYSRTSSPSVRAPVQSSRSFQMPEMDHDWDTPTFQRRNGG